MGCLRLRSLAETADRSPDHPLSCHGACCLTSETQGRASRLANGGRQQAFRQSRPRAWLTNRNATCTFRAWFEAVPPPCAITPPPALSRRGRLFWNSPLAVRTSASRPPSAVPVLDLINHTPPFRKGSARQCPPSSRLPTPHLRRPWQTMGQPK